MVKEMVFVTNASGHVCGPHCACKSGSEGTETMNPIEKILHDALAPAIRAAVVGGPNGLTALSANDPLRSAAPPDLGDFIRAQRAGKSPDTKAQGDPLLSAAPLDMGDHIRNARASR